MKKTFLALGVIALITAAFFVSPLAGNEENKSKASKNEEANSTEKGYDVGDIVEDFKLKNVDGDMLSLSDMEEAKGFIIVFTCNHCPFSVMYEDRLLGFDQMYASQGYPVIAINPNDEIRKPEDSYEAMVTRSAEKKFTFPYLHDSTQEIATTFGATRTPHIYVLAKNEGDLVVKYIGAIDDSPRDAEDVEDPYLHKAMRSIISGMDPDPNFTKAIGCTIKWAE